MTAKKKTVANRYFFYYLSEAISKSKATKKKIICLPSVAVKKILESQPISSRMRHLVDIESKKKKKFLDFEFK